MFLQNLKIFVNNYPNKIKLNSMFAPTVPSPENALAKNIGLIFNSVRES